jgi:Sec-independent protein translocase protein TatA
MEILGIGPLEFLLIVLLALIILGPKELQKAAKSLGQGLNKLVKSDVWKDIQQTTEKVKNLPTELMRDAELDDLRKSLQDPPAEAPKIAPPPSEEKTSPK